MTIPKEIRCLIEDAQIAVQCVKLKPYIIDLLGLPYRGKALTQNKEIARIALKQRGKTCLLRYFEPLEDDEEIVLMAVKRNGMNLHYASSRLKCDRKIIMAALKQNGRALKYVNKELRLEKDVVHFALTMN